MKQILVIKSLAAIAHDGRLSLMRRLIKAGPAGMASGDLANAENIKASTASAQLLVLMNAGLVQTQRHGKQVIYQAHYERFQDLISFLMKDCCEGSCDEQ